MKLVFLIFCMSISFGLSAEVSRSPAVVGGQCDLDIAITKIQKGSEKVFSASITHQVIVRSDDEFGCSRLPKKRYADSIYEENARNEIKILFRKYAQNYSQKCIEHFQHRGLKKSEFECATPEIISMSFSQYGCEKLIEDGTYKVSHAGVASAEIKYKQVGRIIEEKSVEVVQKEQCARVNECIQVASEKEMAELKKLSAVACKVDVVPVSTARAPAIEKDSSFDGNREPKNNSNKDEQQKNSVNSASVLK